MVDEMVGVLAALGSVLFFGSYGNSMHVVQIGVYIYIFFLRIHLGLLLVATLLSRGMCSLGSR